MQRVGDEPIVEEYRQTASAYDRRWGRYVDASARATRARLAVRSDDRLLDIGCGTGTLLGQIAREAPGAQLAGVDLVPAMLDVARAKLPPGVPLQVARAESLPFEDAAFDLAVSSSVLHFVRAPEDALREMYRVVRPGGRVVITDWCHDYPACRILDLYLRLFDRAHSRTYGSATLARMMRAAGFAEVGVERYRVDWWWGLMTVTATRPA